MLLQMIFEKVAKAALLRKGALRVEDAIRSHKAAFAFVRLLRDRFPDGRRLGFPDGTQWHAVLTLIHDLETAHPLRDPKWPNLEYPWESPAGAICLPGRDLDIVRRLNNPRQRNWSVLTQLASTLTREFDTIFP